jgi:hypothetical protein
MGVMVQIHGKAFGIFMPALTDVFIGDNPLRRVKAHRSPPGASSPWLNSRFCKGSPQQGP